MIPPSLVEIALALVLRLRITRTPTTPPGNVVGMTDQGSSRESMHADTNEPIDLAAIERDLAAVEAALPRLDDGSYWLDETTGDEIPDDVLSADPVARRA